RGPTTQLRGYEQSCDLVVAANVRHATADLRRTLRHIERLLAPGGLLMVLELTAHPRWVDISFGLTPGWWRFSDRDLRPSYPLLRQEEWLSLLESAGFRDPVGLPRMTDGGAFDTRQ